LRIKSRAFYNTTYVNLMFIGCTLFLIQLLGLDVKLNSTIIIV